MPNAMSRDDLTDIIANLLAMPLDVTAPVPHDFWRVTWLRFRPPGLIR